MALGLLPGFLVGFFVGRRKGAVPVSPTLELAAPAGDSLPPGISLVVNGRTVDVPAEAMAEIQTLIRAKQKIEAIKALREATGLGLAEAKAVMESLEKVIR